MNTSTVNIPVVNQNSLVTSDELDVLGPGCYVKIEIEDDKFWVEITEQNGSQFNGIVHCELDSSKRCHHKTTNSTKIVFEKSQVIGLGCDNYCWC